MSVDGVYVIVCLRCCGLELTFVEKEIVLCAVEMESASESMEEWTELVGVEIIKRSSARNASFGSDEINSVSHDCVLSVAGSYVCVVSDDKSEKSIRLTESEDKSSLVILVEYPLGWLRCGTTGGVLLRHVVGFFSSIDALVRG